MSAPATKIDKMEKKEDYTIWETPLPTEGIDWSKKDEMVTVFPRWIQEQYALARQKNVSKVVDIEPFSLKTPYGDQVLLKDTRLWLEPGKRACLYGSNGTGKTTLFHNLAHGLVKDFPKHIHVHHCQELEDVSKCGSVIDTVVYSHPFRNVLVKVEEKIKAAQAADPTPDQKEGLQQNLDFVQMNMRNINGYGAFEKASKMLRVLGFDDIGQAKPVRDLSGGLRMRVALCMAFFIEPELLLLDEPTNHLDFPSVLWLENRLRGYGGGKSFLCVTHDRELLENVTTSVLLLENKKINYYACGFKEFETRKAKEDKKKYEEIEKFLKRNQNVDYSTPLGREKEEKKEWQNAYYEKQVRLAGKFTFPASVPLDTNGQVDEAGNPLSQDEVSLIKIDKVRFSYAPNAENPVYIFNDPIDFNVKHGSRIGVMGPNGAGKSTLLKLLTEKIKATEGTVTRHPNFVLAYFGQHSTAELDLELTPIEFMIREFPEVEKTGLLKNHLQKTGIMGNVANTRMQSLSFSQRSCVIFSKLTYVCPHLLIMDEPTNFLDLESVDSLIMASNKYQGALLLVSHNRHFLKKCAKQYLSVVPGKFDLFNDMQSAERSTYSFIQEMESGQKVDKKDALTNNPGGGSVHSSQVKGGVTGGASEEKKEFVFGADGPSDKPAARPVAKPGALTYAVKEKCLALWEDGKHYDAVVTKVVEGKGYQITYTAYGNSAVVPATSLKKAPVAGAKPAAKGAAKAAAKPAGGKR